MARTLAEVDAALTAAEAALATAAADVAALKAWRTNTVGPALSAAQTRFQEADAFFDKVRAAWRRLASGKLDGLDGEAGVEVQERLSAEELRELRWLLAERRKAKGR